MAPPDSTPVTTQYEHTWFPLKKTAQSAGAEAPHLGHIGNRMVALTEVEFCAKPIRVLPLPVALAYPVLLSLERKP